MGSRGFWRELKRRHVYRVAAAYVVVGWLLIQVATQVFPVFHLPDWIEQAAVLLILIGFPVALVLAWAFDATPRGIERIDTSAGGVDASVPPRRRSYRAGAVVGLVGVLIAVAAGGVYWHFGRARLHLSAHAPAPTAVPAVGNPVPTSVPATSGLRTATPPVAAQPIPAKSIAVLPFENLSTDKGNAYFADGMQDLILTKLADIGDLKVISRTSTLQYGSHPENLKQIGQQLGVATILEGSVQKAGNQVLINVQLIDARSDSHLWAESYTRTLDNIFGVEGEVAGKIATALNAKLTPAETAAVAKVGTHNPAALDAILKANYYLADFNRTGDEAELARSVPLYKQAIAADPKYASAYAGLALAYQKLGGHDREAEAAARQALSLDPDNADAHTVYAFALANKGDFDVAIAESEKAVALPTHAANNIDGLGFTLLFAGKIAASTQAFQRAVEADSQSDFSREWAALTQAMLRDYPAARDGLRRVVAHDPGNANAVSELAQVERIGFGDLDAARKALQSAATPAAASAALSEAWYELDCVARDYPAALAVIDAAPPVTFDKQPRELYEALVYRAQGNDGKARSMFATARDQLESKLKVAPNDPDLHGSLAQALAGSGDGDAAIKEAERAMALVPIKYRAWSGPRMLVNLASVEVHTGRNSGAIQVLGRLLAMPAGLDMSVEALRINPDWDPIRNDPRFQALLKKYSQPVPGSTASVSTSGASDGE
jgi:serine/threonine-protein kinase